MIQQSVGTSIPDNARSMSPPPPSSENVEQPEKYDILCGKDKTYGMHPGNLAFRVTIDNWVEAYKHSNSKEEKMKITRRIVAHMQNQFRSRFLKLTVEHVWQEIPDQAARDKVSHALRFTAKHRNDRSTPSSLSLISLRSRASQSPERSNISRRDERTPPSHSKHISDDEKVDDENVDSLFERQQAILEKLRNARSPTKTFSASEIVIDAF
jgi:hypothetical protein